MSKKRRKHTWACAFPSKPDGMIAFLAELDVGQLKDRDTPALPLVFKATGRLNLDDASAVAAIRTWAVDTAQRGVELARRPCTWFPPAEFGMPVYRLEPGKPPRALVDLGFRPMGSYPSTELGDDDTSDP